MPRIGATVGIGAGQMSRVDSARIAARKAQDAADELKLAAPLTKGSVVASDAFFPFADGLLARIEAGATAVIQPGGSMRDDEVIKAADEPASPWCSPACAISGIDRCRPCEADPATGAATIQNSDRWMDPAPHDDRSANSASPATKNSTSTAMPAFWLAVIAVIDADQQRPDERGDLSGQREQPEILRDAVFRRELDQKRARRRLQRAAGGADQAAQQRDRRARRRRRTSAPPGTGGATFTNRIESLSTSRIATIANSKNHHAAGDHPLRPERVVELAAEPGAKRAGDREKDAEGADLDRVPAEGAGGVDAAERKQRHQAVGVDHVGEQKCRHRFLLRQFAQRLPQLDQAFAQRLAQRAPRRIIRRQQEHRQHEDDEPDAGQRAA